VARTGLLGREASSDQVGWVGMVIAKRLDPHSQLSVGQRWRMDCPCGRTPKPVTSTFTCLLLLSSSEWSEPIAEHNERGTSRGLFSGDGRWTIPVERLRKPPPTPPVKLSHP
jgi:hypothetical protein